LFNANASLGVTIDANANIDTDGNITAPFYFGDGSNLTGITGGGSGGYYYAGASLTFDDQNYFHVNDDNLSLTFYTQTDANNNFLASGTYIPSTTAWDNNFTLRGAFDSNKVLDLRYASINLVDTNWATEGKDFKELSDLNNIYDDRYSVGIHTIDTNYATEGFDFADYLLATTFIPSTASWDTNYLANVWNTDFNANWLNYFTGQNISLLTNDSGFITSYIDSNASTSCITGQVLGGADDGCIETSTFGGGGTDTTLDTNTTAETSWLAKEHSFTVNQTFDGNLNIEADLNVINRIFINNVLFVDVNADSVIFYAG